MQDAVAAFGCGDEFCASPFALGSLNAQRQLLISQFPPMQRSLLQDGGRQPGERLQSSEAHVSSPQQCHGNCQGSHEYASCAVDADPDCQDPHPLAASSIQHACQ